MKEAHFIELEFFYVCKATEDLRKYLYINGFLIILFSVNCKLLFSLDKNKNSYPQNITRFVTLKKY